MSYMNYMGNTYGNGGILGQTGFAGINYQPQQQTPVQTANYGLNMGIQFASKEEMEALRLNPNGQAMAFGKEGDVFYIKTADSLGRSTLKVFDFKEREENKPAISYATKEDLGMFAVKDDLTALHNKINALESKLANMNKNVSRETMEVKNGK